MVADGRAYGVERLGFGLMRLPLLDAQDPTSVDERLVCELVDTFIERGGRHFDTAYIYHGGASERAVRTCVAGRHPRDSFTLTDKLPMGIARTRERAEEIFDEQLERCGVDFFDYYWLHGLTEEGLATAERSGAFELLRDRRRSGQIRHTGFSFHDSAEVLDRALSAHPEIECVQLQLNYLDWEDPTIQARACWEVARAHGKSVFVMEPLKGGILAGVPPAARETLAEANPSITPAAWAFRFAASLTGVVSVLSGMRDAAILAENLRTFALGEPLGAEQAATLARAAGEIRSSVIIPCTGCRYCVDHCPRHIAIPEYFSIYNNWKRNEGEHTAETVVYYANLARSHGRASECIACGRCERACPQHLPIPTWMREVSGVLDAWEG